MFVSCFVSKVVFMLAIKALSDRNNDFFGLTTG